MMLSFVSLEQIESSEMLPRGTCQFLASPNPGIYDSGRQKLTFLDSPSLVHLEESR